MKHISVVFSAPFDPFVSVSCVAGLVVIRVPKIKTANIHRMLEGHSCWLSRKHLGGARGVVVIVVGNGHSDTSSNPGRD